MFRALAGLLIAGLLAFAAACTDGDGLSPLPTTRTPSIGGSTVVPVSRVARPAAVPLSALEVQQTAGLGRIIRTAGQDPQAVMTRELTGSSCANDVLVIETSQETIYAALPCDRFWDGEAEAAFLGAQVAIVLEVTEPRLRVLIETLAGAQAEFTVGGIWVE